MMLRAARISNYNCHMNDSFKDKISKIKCILFDLDGTLMHAHPTFISQYSADVLNRLQDKGYYVGFSTGRALTSLGFLLRPVGLRTNIPSIGCAGAEIGPAGTEPGRAIYTHPFPGDTLVEMLKLAVSFGMNFSLDAHGTLYTSQHLEYAATYMTNYRLARQYGAFFPKPHPLSPDEIDQVNDGTVLKPMLWFDSEKQFHRMDPWFDKHPELHYQSSGFSLMEVQTNDVSKAIALASLAAYLGISEEECCVFGDSENDLPILQAAGLSVAMINGFEVAKASSDILTEFGNNEDGAARMAEKLFLTEETI